MLSSSPVLVCVLNLTAATSEHHLVEMVQNDATRLGPPLLACDAFLLAIFAENDLALLAFKRGLYYKFAHRTHEITEERSVNNLPNKLWMLLVGKS